MYLANEDKKRRAEVVVLKGGNLGNDPVKKGASAEEVLFTRIKAQFPKATNNELVVEIYRALGGLVVEETPPEMSAEPTVEQKEAKKAWAEKATISAKLKARNAIEKKNISHSKVQKKILQDFKRESE